MAFLQRAKLSRRVGNPDKALLSFGGNYFWADAFTSIPFVASEEIPQKEEVNIYLDAHFPPFQLPFIQRMMLFYSVIHT